VRLRVTDNDDLIGIAEQQVTVVSAGSGTGYTLTVSPTAGGSVTSSPGGISCTLDYPEGCSAIYDSGTTVTLTAFLYPGFSSANWTGCNDVSEGGTVCMIIMNSYRNVNVTFSP
jgi:hypothetical protein